MKKLEKRRAHCFKALIATLLMVILPSIGQAQTISTIGDRSCGGWAAYRFEKDDVRSIANQAWLTGFMTGMAVASKKNSLSGVDGETLLLWMDKYCRENPLKNISSGAIELHFELLRRKQ